jgi:hypothetical protein
MQQFKRKKLLEEIKAGIKNLEDQAAIIEMYQDLMSPELNKSMNDNFYIDGDGV